MKRIDPKRVVNGLLACSMTVSSMSALPVRGLAAEQEAALEQLVYASDTETAGDTGAMDVYTEHPERLEGDAKIFIGMIDQLYGIDSDATELSEAVIARFAVAIYTNDEEKAVMEEKIAEIKAMYTSFSDEVILKIAGNCPVRLAAYATIDSNKTVADAASKVAMEIIAINKFDVTTYHEEKATLNTALNDYQMLLDATDEISAKAVKVLQNDLYPEEAVSYAAKLSSVKEEYDICRKQQKDEFETAVAVLPSYIYDNFLEVSDKLAVCKEKWANILLDDLIAELKAGESYAAYETMLANEYAFNKDAVFEINSAYKTVNELSNELYKLEERDAALKTIESYAGRYAASYYKDIYRDFKLYEEDPTLGEIFDAVPGARDLYKNEVIIRGYLDKADEYVATFPEPADYVFTQEEIDGNYKNICDLIATLSEDYSTVTSEANIALINKKKAALEAIKLGMMDKSAEYLDEIQNKIDELSSCSEDEKFTTTYIDQVNNVGDSVDGVLNALKEISPDKYQTAVEAIALLGTELRGIVDRRSEECSSIYGDMINMLADSGLAYNTYEPSIDSHTLDDARTALSNARDTYRNYDDEYDIIRYYKDNVDKELVMPDRYSIIKACDAYEEHIGKIEELRAGADAVNMAFEGCPVDILPPEDDDFDELYTFIMSNFGTVPESDWDNAAAAMEANENFNAAYAPLSAAMEKYIVLTNAYAEKYPEEAFVNDGGIYVDGGRYERWSRTSEYVAEYMGETGQFEEARIAAENYIKTLEEYYNRFVELAANTAVSANDGYAEDYAYIKEQSALYDSMYNEWKALKKSESTYFIPETVGSEMLPYINTEIEHWNDAIAYTDEINKVLAVKDTRHVDTNYDKCNPQIYIPSIYNKDGAEELADKYTKILKDDEHTGNAYVSTDAVAAIIEADVEFDADHERYNELVADRDFVKNWKEDVNAIPTITETSKLSNDILELIEECEAGVPVINDDSDKLYYANMAETEEQTPDYLQFTDMLNEKAHEYRITLKAYELDNELLRVSAMEPGSERFAAYKELEKWFIENEDTDDGIKTIIRMSRYAIYNVLFEEYFNAEIKAFIEAANTENVISTTDLDAFNAQYNTAMKLYEALTAEQKSDLKVDAAMTTLTYNQIEYERWMAAKKSTSEFANTVVDYESRIYEMDEIGMTGEQYKSFEDEYKNVIMPMLLDIEKDDTDEKLSDASAYLADNGYKSRLTKAYNVLTASFAYVNVYNKINEVYAASTAPSFASLGHILKEAEDLYSALSGEHKMKVTNYGLLVAARREYDKLGYGQDSRDDFNILEAVINLEEPTFDNYSEVGKKAAEIDFYISTLSRTNANELYGAIEAEGVYGKLERIIELCELYSKGGGLKGDIDDDGNIYINDITYMISSLMHIKEFENIGMELRADFNGDGKFTAEDIELAISNITYTVVD